MKKRLAWVGLTLLCLIGGMLSAVWMFVAAMRNPDGRRAWQIAEGFDQTGNAMIGGSEDETISYHSARARRAGKLWGKASCWLLDKVDHNHCEKALTAEETGCMLRILQREKLRGTFEMDYIDPNNVVDEDPPPTDEVVELSEENEKPPTQRFVVDTSKFQFYGEAP